MSGTSYQIRECKNPDCGLRFPLMKEAKFGERCPACLGITERVLEKPLNQYSGQEITFPPKDTQLDVLLDNIRSGLNVGSIFRSADGFNFKHIYLGGITPTPDNAQVRKSALGAEDHVKWSVCKNALKSIGDLKDQGHLIWSLEKMENSNPIHTATASLKKNSHLVLIVGNEVTGIDPGILEISDRIVHIPMRGYKRSFNVAVAFAIAAYSLQSQV